LESLNHALALSGVAVKAQFHHGGSLFARQRRTVLGQRLQQFLQS
jgi:hypothetical protein